MRRLKLALFLAFAIVSAAIFARLGVWQLHRLAERRAQNALVLSRLDSAEVEALSLPRDTALAQFRRVRVTGVPDYAHQLLWADRSYRGSPGLNFMTPVRVAGHDTAVIVDRGWVYSPDGATVDEKRWQENDTTFVGYAEEFPDQKGTTFTNKPRIIARLSHSVVQRALPYPVATMFMVELGDSTIAPDKIARLTVPPLDEGPHMSYAIQWFSFAAIALVGAGIALASARRERTF